MLVITLFLTLLFSLILIDINFETNLAPFFVWLIVVLGWIYLCFTFILTGTTMPIYSDIDKKTFAISKKRDETIKQKRTNKTELCKFK